MPTLRDIPPEITSSFCEYLDRPDLRNVRLMNRAFNSAARPILFRTIFLKVNIPIIIYDGRELDLSETTSFEEWLCYRAATGIGLATQKKREVFLARFSRQQLQEYYSNFCRYVRLTQGPILEGGNEIKWLREATRRFPRLSVVEYAESEQALEEGRELQPMSFFSPIAQQTLAAPEEGWGAWDSHFWALVRTVFYGQQHPQQVKTLRGEMLNHENLRKLDQVIPHLDLRSLQLLSLDFVFEYHESPTPTRTLAAFLKRAPNLRSLRLSYGDHPGSLNNPASFLPTRLFDKPLHWKHLRNLSVQNLVLSPSRLQQLLQGHSTTLRSLELSHMTLQHGGETIVGRARALWITMIEFLSQSMSLERVKLVGYFTTDTNEAWSTFGSEQDVFVCPPRREGCLLSRIEHFIVHGGPCPFTLKSSETLFDVDMDVSHDEGPWIPEHSWTWEEDDTWRFTAFLINL